MLNANSSIYLYLPQLLLVGLIANPACAQRAFGIAQTTNNNYPKTNIINPIEPNNSDFREPELLPPVEELLQPQNQEPQINVTPDVTQPPSSQNIPDRITVNQFQFEGSTVFTQEELANITKDYIGERSFAELLQAAEAVTKYYVDQGYVTSGAFIPPQVLENGVIKVQILEGSLETVNINFNGKHRLRPGYIQSRIANGTKTPLNINNLLKDLQLLQVNPLIQQLSAELAAGSRPGQSILDLTVTQADTFSAFVGIDNGRSPSVGTWRYSGGISEANLFGFGDTFNLSYDHTKGSDELSEASYSIPLNSKNGTLKFLYTTSGNDVIEEPFNQLDIHSNATDYDLSFRQPLIQTPTQELALGLAFNKRESNTTLLGEPYPLSPGANDDGETRLSVLRFFQDWTQRNNKQVFALRSQFSVGLDIWDATINEQKPDGQFFSWRGQAQYLRLLAPDTVFLIRSDLQLSADPLVPLEQFGLGGMNSVRGYRQDLLITDSGLFLSAEARIPIVRIRPWNSIIQIAPFVDFGTVWNSPPRSNPIKTTLSSVGLGLLWNIGKDFTFRFDWGIPLVDIDLEKDNLQEDGLYFSVQYRPF